jgi:replicative DNA helicase
MASTEPNDIPAEQAALGAMITSAAVAQVLAKTLVPEDFYRPAHQTIFKAILADIRDGLTPDAITVNTRLMASGDSAVTGGGIYLHTLMEACPVAVNGPVYAATVREHAISRRVRQAGTRLIDWAQSRDGDSAGLVDRTLREIEAVRDSGQPTGGPRAKPVYEFLDVPDDQDAYDWVIPGLMERADRLILTGVEGGGKSELFRQMAVCTAAGIHPFSFDPIPPQRVWILDRENSERHTRRKLWPLMDQANSMRATVEPENLWVDSGPERMDLARDRDVSWLLSEVAAIRPDIAFLGPLYKLAPRALNDDSEAAPVLAALDMIRERGVAICIEAHAGHGTGPGGQRDMRVRGSAAFMGWPEFAYGLRWAETSTNLVREVDFVAWRGDRDTGRAWPERLKGGGPWPWTGIYPEGTFRTV